MTTPSQTTTAHPSQRILGIDPGYDRLGWAILDVTGHRTQLVDCGCIQTSKKTDRFTRYQQLEHELDQVVQQYQPTTASIEQLYASVNTTTVIGVAEARGIILSVLLRHHLTISEHNPGTVKLAVTGYGRAEKSAVKKMVRLQISQLSTLSTQLQQKLDLELDDTYDAIGLALTAATLGTTVEKL